MDRSFDKFRQGLRSILPENDSISAPTAHSNGSYVVVRSSSRTVSLSTCTKMCTITFFVGIIVGFTLKRRLRRWATKLLKRWKDD